MIQTVMSSSIGSLYLVAADSGLQGILWKPKAGLEVLSAEAFKALNPTRREVQILKLTLQQLGEYFRGERTQFDIPLNPQGTPFQKQVWAELSKIGYGQTYSYKDIASKLNKDKACRAVGSANGKNPISIVIPCHRVIAADGTLGGYAGTLPVKKTLLELEAG